jgi:transcriptional regulator with XRE-family HTH domain
MDYARLASELLRALRARRSQVALSRRLGYAANVAYAWESGRRFPPATVLFRITALNRGSLEAVATFVQPMPLPALEKRAWSALETSALLRALTGETPVVQVARTVHVDRTTVTRWLQGRTEPRVPELLQFVDAMSHRLIEFLALFVDPAELRSVRAIARGLAAQRRMAYKLPLSHAVLRALELEQYRNAASHIPGLIARSVGIDLDQEKRLLAELRAARLIHRVHGKWQPTRVLTVDTRADPERDQRLKEHWAEVGLERLRRSTARREALYSYNLFSVSHTDFERIRQLHLEYYEHVRRIVAESDLAERVVLLNQQLIPLDE